MAKVCGGVRHKDTRVQARRRKGRSKNGECLALNRATSRRSGATSRRSGATSRRSRKESIQRHDVDSQRHDVPESSKNQRRDV